MLGKKQSVLVAMSGGVDSSVAAYLLRQGGYEVTGVFLCLGGTVGSDHDSRGCCSPADQADARKVAQKLGIELFVLNAAEDFSGIIEYFLDEYARGRTPNPCVHCNTRVKFSRLIARADDLGIRHVATGHYARVVGCGWHGLLASRVRYGSNTGCEQPVPPHNKANWGFETSSSDVSIHRGRTKDQSYALFGVDRRHLERALLPIGELSDKAQVRRIAAELGLGVAEKPDSQEICFVSGSYTELLRQRRPEVFRPGDIIDSSGRVLGRHDGVGQFTIGQRRGLRLARGVPMYVTRIDPVAATVTIGPAEETLGDRLTARSVNWHIDPPTAGSEFPATVQIRYNHAGAAARVRITGPDAFEVRFERPVAAITPGQAAVIYDGDRLLGGGWIQ